MKIFKLMFAFAFLSACSNNTKPKQKTSYNTKIDFKQIEKKFKTCNDEFEKYDYYKKCNLPLEEKMIRVGDSNAKIKLLTLVGGPQQSFKIPREWLEPFNEKSPSFMASTKWLANQNVEIIYVRQAQFTKPSQFSKDMDGFNMENAKLENFESVETTHQLAKYFKSQGFIVGLAGDSFGAQLINLYLKEYGSKTPDVIFSQHGRLIKYTGDENLVDSAILQAAAKQDYKILMKALGWNKDDPKAVKSAKLYTSFTQIFTSLDNEDFTKTIDKDSMSNVIFFTGEKDHHIGAFSKKEIDWVKSSNAKLVYYNEKDVLKLMKTHKKESGNAFKHSMGKSVNTASHMAFALTKDEYIKQILVPLGWKPEWEDVSIDYYNN